jgi:glycosyl hydrolase family 106( putative alpha-L-rhamnosidase)
MALEDQFMKVGNGGVKFRGVPFWSWNDDLDADELARQTREMAKVGLGGHFMHARRGLVTPYMGRDWMACIKATVKASKQAGVKAWLYDENCWPSGSAGGAVPAMGEEYVGKALKWEVIPSAGFKADGNTVATFLIQTGEGGALECRQTDPKHCSRRAKEPEQVLHFYYRSLSYGNQPTYIDVMSHKAVKAFIRHTHNGYRKAVGKEFGKVVPGIFTDEPQYGRPIPWSFELPKAFQKQRGYDLIESLPMMAFEVGEFKTFRHDFWRTCTDLYVDAFTKQIGEWCGKHKIALTGHMNAEDTLASQIACIGAAMPHYEHMQIPGIDHLSRGLGTHLLCKQVSSMAHQFGGRRVLSEMFGCCGWNVSFEELRWIAAYQFALGIDLVCQHLSLYSLRGCRKRDYPPSLHYQQPYWDDYKLLNDYFARVTFMLTQGKHVANVLVLHSIESAWAEYDAADSSCVDKLSDQLESLCRTLMGIHYDFDLGDEGVLASHGSITKGQVKVRSCTYQVVVVPPCTSLRSSTVALLKRFIDQGGDVLLVGDAPTMVDGRESDEAAEVLEYATPVEADGASLKSALQKLLPPQIEVLTNSHDADTVYVQQRNDKTRQIYFLTNTEREKVVHAVVRLPGAGRLESWDPSTGEVTTVHTVARGKSRVAELDFEPMGCHMLVHHPRKKPATVRVRKPKRVRTTTLSNAWLLERTEPNALTIDYCSYRIGTGEWSKRMPMLALQKELEKIDGSEVCEFKYTFQADFHEKLPHDLCLIVEDPGAYEIFMNGLPVGSDNGNAMHDEGWWRDISFRRFNVSSMLRPQSRNEIMLRRVIDGIEARKELMQQLESRPIEVNRLKFGPEIEAVYITGQFLVRSASSSEPLERGASRTRGPFTLIDDWHQSETGDLTAQGLPFYAGTARMSQTFKVTERVLKSAKRATLVLDPPDAIVTRVFVNGHEVGVRTWRPFEFEIHEHLLPGRNEITVELTNSCRNLLGPHHHVDGELHSVGPGSFSGSKGWTDRGDTSAVTWTDTYSFARFGLVEPGKIVFTK